MSSIASSVVTIETSPECIPSTPSWLGEVAVMAHYLSRLGLLERIALEVRFSRGRFGIYEVIDFVAVLIGYALSGERTLEKFYERLEPFALPFMALFAREQLPSRSALSRYLGALDQSTVEALRSLFQEDLLARPPREEGGEQRAGLQDRCADLWKVFDEDATRQAARQRALPHSSDLPSASRRMNEVCAPGYTGRKRGEVVRTRTTLLQAHTQQWFGTYGQAGNGDYRGDLLRSVQILMRYAAKENLPLAHILLRLDGQYGEMAVVIDLASRGLCFLTRGKDYGLLDLPLIQAHLQGPPDEVFTHAETGTSRALFDCPHFPLPGTGLTMRVIVATHPATGTPAPIGVTRDGVVLRHSSSPPCRNALLLLAMSLLCTCIEVPSRPSSPTRTKSKILTAGSLRHPVDRSFGKSSPNGCGTCVWNWAIVSIRLRCASPNLRRPNPLPTVKLPSLI